MTTVAGASRYLLSSRLANEQGLSAQSTSLLDGSGSSAVSILNVGRRLASGNGIGLSASARALNEQFLNRSSDINEMFSLGVGPAATLDGMSQEILALRAGLSDRQVSRSLLGQEVDVVDSDGKDLSASQKVFGQEVDKTA